MNFGISVILLIKLLKTKNIKNQFINHQNFKVMAETTNYNVENAMKDQEQNQNKVAKDAVQMAKENIAKRKLEEESRKVESRLQEASRQEDRALKELRVNRKKEAAAKKYLEDINAAKTTFESSGDWRKYDADVEKAAEERDKAIENAKREIYGDDYWRY